MAGMDLAALIRPVADDGPCGTDLDLEGDAAYMNFMAAAEGLLPRTFFKEDVESTGKKVQRPFDRNSIDFAAVFAQAAPLTRRTQDLRLLVLLAKFHALNRELDGFRSALEACATLAGTRWEEVHPRGEAGDFSLRVIALEQLNDPVPVLMPLQFLPLATHKRYGSVSYRIHMAATGQIAAGTDKIDVAAIERTMAEADLAELVALRDEFTAIDKALARIQAVFSAKLGPGKLKLDPLRTLIGRIHALLEGVVVKRDPSAASVPAPPADDGEETAVPAPPTQGVLTSLDAAVDALAAATEYFQRCEPSSPALPLLWQAQALVGKSFLEAIQLLVPAQAQRAALRIGAETNFDLPIDKLGTLAPKIAASTEDKPRARPPAKSRSATTRDEATFLLQEVATFYRRHEPSSAIPLLTDRARTFSGKDFLTLLAEVLPKKP